MKHLAEAEARGYRRGIEAARQKILDELQSLRPMRAALGMRVMSPGVLVDLAEELALLAETKEESDG
jgi:hypothetical protein